MSDDYNGPIESGTSVISPTGETVINCKRDPQEIMRRFPGAEFAFINKHSGIAQRDPVFCRIEAAPEDAASDPLAVIESRTPAFADFTGAEHEDPVNFRYVGQARNTAFLQGNKDVIDGDFAAETGGGKTVNNTGDGAIPTGADIIWCPPTTPNLNNDHANAGRRLAQLQAFNVKKHTLRDDSIYEKIQAQRHGLIDVKALVKAEQQLYTAAWAVWEAIQAQWFASAVQALENEGGAMLSDAKKLDLAEKHGLISARQGPDIEERRKRNTAYQNRMINTAFARTVVGAAGESQPSEDFAAFASAIGGKFNPNRDQMSVISKQLGSAGQLIDALNTTWYSVSRRIIGWATRGAKPQLDLDMKMY